MAGRCVRPGQGGGAAGEIGFATLLYRFWFFDWLFADMTAARGVVERHAAWQHNRCMRRHLPRYLWRWFVATALAFALGCLAEYGLETALVAAGLYTSSAVTLTGMVVILVMYAFLAQPRYW